MNNQASKRLPQRSGSWLGMVLGMIMGYPLVPAQAAVGRKHQPAK